MKAIIVASISLFSLATIFGMADYYSAKKTGILNRLYTEEAPVKKAAIKSIELEDYSRGKLEAAAEEVFPAPKKEVVKAAVVTPKRSATKRSSRSKKPNLKMFSRGKLEPIEIPFAEVKE